jgi:glycosyltransferase involved in cell wall biosynthesis
MVEHGQHFGADVNFSMQDVHAINPQFLQQLKHWIPYTPIDRDEIPQSTLNNLRFAYKIITFSKFGQKALAKHGFASTMIPEGVDTNVFKPLDKRKVREELHFPQDKFIFGMIGANKPDGVSRKGWQQALDAFAIFAKTHPEAMFFYQFNQGGGFDIPAYAQHLGIHDRLITPNIYMSVIHGDPNIVNQWLNCCDVILHASTTEGFGLVIAEAQAAGTPVIVNNCHSQPELVIEGKTGEICESKFKLWTAGGGYIYFPDPESLNAKMEILYEKVKKDENKISTSCRAWIVDNYSIDKIVEKQWIPYLTDLQTELLGVPQVDITAKKA